MTASVFYAIPTVVIGAVGLLAVAVLFAWLAWVEARDDREARADADRWMEGR